MPYYKVKYGKIITEDLTSHEGDILKGPAEKYDNDRQLQKVIPAVGNCFYLVKYGNRDYDGQTYHQGDYFEAVEGAFPDDVQVIPIKISLKDK